MQTMSSYQWEKASWLEDGIFTRTEVENIVSHMQKINKVLVAEGEVHLI
jgi:hypothetical protein